VPLGFIFGVAAFWFAHPTAATMVWGVVVAMLGEGLRIWAAGHLNKSREVTSSGPYRWLGHPLYVGSAIVGAGLAIASNSAVTLALVAVYLATTVVAAIRTEHAFLRRTFGEDYLKYRRGDRAAAADRRFSVSRAMANREYRAVVGLVVAALLLAWKATYNGSFWRAGG
jgi:protein-S-isoprenylcysteine O-methyltransferase Ste14